MIPMRDGVQLKTIIYRPETNQKFPALLCRTPYGSSGFNNKEQCTYFAEHEYAVIYQNSRGKFGSEGTWKPYDNEIRDGEDTINWIIKQPWSNGKVGTFGRSYPGYTQIACGLTGNPHLLAMCPDAAPYPLIPSTNHTGGTLQFLQVVLWATYTAGIKLNPLREFDWNKLLKKLPVISILDKTGIDTTFYKDCINNYLCKRMDFLNIIKSKNIKAANLCITGWYDHITPDVLDYYSWISKQKKLQHRLIIGPWDHSSTGLEGDKNLVPQVETVYEVENVEVIRWMNRWLKNGSLEEDPVRIFIMGENVWREEKEWPLSRTEYTPFYLHSKGYLSTTIPEDEPFDNFAYNPSNPVPTIGGCNSGPSPLAGISRGPFDQSQLEKREDVLVYKTEALKKEIEITGYIKVVLYASSSVRDTDFTAKLTDVYPDGRSIIIQDGIVRAKFRESFEKESLLKPGKIYKFEIDLWATSYLFKKEHRINMDISSSNFPRFDRNLNTGENNELGVHFTRALQKVYHDKKHPSHILLPVIPR